MITVKIRIEIRIEKKKKDGKFLVLLLILSYIQLFKKQTNKKYPKVYKTVLSPWECAGREFIFSSLELIINIQENNLCLGTIFHNQLEIVKRKDLAGFINKIFINLPFKYFKTFTHLITKKMYKNKYTHKNKSHALINR